MKCNALLLRGNHFLTLAPVSNLLSCLDGDGLIEVPVLRVGLQCYRFHVHVRNTFTQHQHDMYEDRTHDLRVTNTAL
jgi:hypothetical protein